MPVRPNHGCRVGNSRDLACVSSPFICLSVAALNSLSSNTLTNFDGLLFQGYILFGDPNDLRKFNDLYRSVKTYMRKGWEPHPMNWDHIVLAQYSAAVGTELTTFGILAQCSAMWGTGLEYVPISILITESSSFDIFPLTLKISKEISHTRIDLTV